MNTAVRVIIAIVIALALATGAGFARAERGTRDEAITMVKKAIESIKTDAPKTYAEITAQVPAYHDRDLYAIVYDSTGRCLAHGNNPNRAGQNMIDDQDANGVHFIQDRMELMKTQASFWQEYKYSDPITKRIRPKSTYCERLNDTVVCVGVYK